jgi:hypothetical protein
MGAHSSEELAGTPQSTGINGNDRGDVGGVCTACQFTRAAEWARKRALAPL